MDDPFDNEVTRLAEQIFDLQDCVRDMLGASQQMAKAAGMFAAAAVTRGQVAARLVRVCGVPAPDVSAAIAAVRQRSDAHRRPPAFPALPTRPTKG